MDFRFHTPLRFFEKAGAGDKSRRIAGIISTEQMDQEGEKILQRGLDFDYFLKKGWYNDNHSKKTTDILGYPESVQQFKKGQTLPDGTQAPSNLTWAEGYLLRTKKADEVWELGKALADTPRSLGYSVEGKIQKRTGRANKTIARAMVRNVAITNAPVNAGSRLAILAKSLRAVEDGRDPVELFKTLSMGTPTTPGVAPVGPQTGEGAGQVLAVESLESKDNPPKVLDDDDDDDDKKKKRSAKVKKSLSDVEATAILHRRLPGATGHQVSRLLDVIKTMKRKGMLT